MANYTDISFDTTEIDHLDQLLARAAGKPHAVRATELGRVAQKVASEGRAIVETYHTDSTGLLAESIEVEGTPVYQRIHADVREAEFLEYGSPNTGAPRAWLTGPARKGADELFEILAAATEDVLG